MLVIRMFPFSWALVLLVLAGCSSNDDKALNEFSRAYSGFHSRAEEVNTCARMPLDNEGHFWTALKEAVDTSTSDADRVDAATAAIGAYRTDVVPMMAVCASFVQSMDTSVGTLIEAANRIKNDQLRFEAVGIAKHSRALQVAFSLLLPLYQQRLEMTTNMLNDELRAKGVPSKFLFNHRTDAITALRKETDNKWQEVASAWRDTEDAFSALKGKTKLTDY